MGKNGNNEPSKSDSIAWGIEDPDKDIRKKAFEYLHEIGLSTGLFYGFSLNNLKTENGITLHGLEENKIIKEIFSQGCSYCISLDPGKGEEKIQIDDIKTIKELYSFIEKNVKGKEEMYNISFVEFIKKIKESFTGTAISDGKGKLLIEVLMGETDIRKITREGADFTNLDSAFYSNFNTVPSKFPTMLPLEHLIKLEEMFHYHPGFFKYIYGFSRGQTRIWPIFSSRNPIYLKTLENDSDAVKYADIIGDMRNRIIRNLKYPRAAFDDSENDFEDR